jgi:hypothetical protein
MTWRFNKTTSHAADLARQCGIPASIVVMEPPV